MSSAEREEILRLRSLIADKAQNGWEAAWQQGTTPWNGDAPQAALVELVDKRWSEVGAPWPKGGRALVPGCGAGYDCVYLAKRGLDTVGQDLAATGIAAARKFLASSPDPPTNVKLCVTPSSTSVLFRTQDEEADKAERSEVANFFETKEQAQYDLCYDYTFLCAIPPEMRKTWAKCYAQVTKPNGLLVTLMYPLDGDRQGGPPYSLSEELYQELLSANFDCIYSQVPKESNEGHAGREKMAVWKRR